MTKTISLKQARSRFFSLVDKADRLSARFLVTKNGTPKAVVMGAEEYERWVETLELLSNAKAVKSLEQGLKEAKRGSSGRLGTCSAKSSETSASYCSKIWHPSTPERVTKSKTPSDTSQNIPSTSNR